MHLLEDFDALIVVDLWDPDAATPNRGRMPPDYPVDLADLVADRVNPLIADFVDRGAPVYHCHSGYPRHPLLDSRGEHVAAKRLWRALPKASRPLYCGFALNNCVLYGAAGAKEARGRGHSPAVAVDACLASPWSYRAAEGRIGAEAARAQALEEMRGMGVEVV